MIRKIGKLFYYFVNVPLYWLSKLIPKDEKIWIFGAWFGQKYSDNSKYLFEYVNESCNDIKAVWIIDSEEHLKLLKEKKYTAYRKFSYNAIKYALKAKCAIIMQRTLAL